MEINKKNVLILGTGQIGFAVFEEMDKFRCNLIVLSVLSYHEKKELEKRISTGKYQTKVEIIYGDIYERVNDSDMLTSICKEYNIEIIVDCINTSASIGAELSSEITNSAKVTSIEKLYNFIFSLKRSFDSQKVMKYLKVSTTGLGGMGINMPYTHGDTKEDILSKEILGKLAVSGAFHQLLWAMFRTPGYDVSVIVPAACIGWESIKSGIVNYSDGGKLSKQAKKSDLSVEICEINLAEKQVFTQVYLGENNTYSTEEVALLTQFNQMEYVDKGRIAEYVISDITDKNKQLNLLALMNHSMIQSSFKDSFYRDNLLKEMDRAKSESDWDSLFTDNLGRDVSKDLSEIYVIKQLLYSSGKLTLSHSRSEIQNFVDVFSKNNPRFINHLCSMNYGVLSDNKLTITPELRDSIYIDYVDLSTNIILNWIDRFRFSLNKFYSLSDYRDAKYFLDVLENPSSRVGEILGAIYSAESKGRTDYASIKTS